LKVGVTGAAGLVGRALSAYCTSIGDEVFAYSHNALDVSDPDAVKRTLKKDQPEVVINCAAWTDVDGCELDREHAYAANAIGPENLAKASREINAGFVTISTDYVFNGDKTGFYTQDDKPCPASVYGMSKLEGERRSQRANPRSIVVRTGFIFGRGGTNFLSTIVDRARRGEKLKAITDAYGTPTYSRDLATRLRELAQKDAPGVYHVVNAGDGVSYERFARMALDLAGLSAVDLEGIEMGSLLRPAPRPRNSRLKCLFSAGLGLAPLPTWSDSLRNFVSSEAPKEAALTT
jgi:dTDP-4-dehydrorhamnose reductase